MSNHQLSSILCTMMCPVASSMQRSHTSGQMVGMDPHFAYPRTTCPLPAPCPHSKREGGLHTCAAGREGFSSSPRTATPPIRRKPHLSTAIGGICPHQWYEGGGGGCHEGVADVPVGTPGCALRCEALEMSCFHWMSPAMGEWHC